VIRTGQSRDQRRYEALQKIGCIACLLDGYPEVPGDVHHIVDKGYRRLSGGNQATMVLCKWHHVGQPPTDYTVAYMHSTRGPSMHWHGKEFTHRYGSQRALLAKVNELIKCSA
jgi:hypothetical protein